MPAILEPVARLDPQRSADLDATDLAMGIRHVPGQWSPQWARAEMRQMRVYAYHRGECPDCGEPDGSHEPGCPNEPWSE